MKQKEEEKLLNLACLNCEVRGTQKVFYSCCFEPVCENCYSGFHFLECKKKYPVTHCKFETTARKSLCCQRCDVKLTNEIHICKSCNDSIFCPQCSSKIHSKGKFLTHNFQKQNLNRQQQIIQCPDHKKMRCILTENNNFVCSECVFQHKIKKSSVVSMNEESLDEKITLIELTSKYFLKKKEEHENKWNKIKKHTELEYKKLIQTIQQRYQKNIELLNRVSQGDLKLIEKAILCSEKMDKQVSFFSECQEGYLFSARTAMMIDELKSFQKAIKMNECYDYKYSQVDYERFDSLLRNGGMQRNKLKEEEDKQNRSNRKSNPSSNKLIHNQNLSSSRRSLSRSIQKKNDPKQNVKNITKCYRDSFRGSQLESSHRKSQKENPQKSLIHAKIQQLKPMVLNFDANQSQQASKINFLSSKTQESDMSNTLDSNNNSRSSMLGKALKRKSDFFQLRERMRKPSVLTNRFSKK